MICTSLGKTLFAAHNLSNHMQCPCSCWRGWIFLPDKETCFICAAAGLTFSFHVVLSSCIVYKKAESGGLNEFTVTFCDKMGRFYFILFFKFVLPFLLSQMLKRFSQIFYYFFLLFLMIYLLGKDLTWMIIFQKLDCV